jgi:hypothetical protein
MKNAIVQMQFILRGGGGKNGCLRLLFVSSFVCSN